MNRAYPQPNIPAAIRRARRVRTALRSRRRRAVAIAGSASLAIAVALGLSAAAAGPADLVHAAVSQARSLADLLAQRSPGGRTQAELVKTKRPRALAKHVQRPPPPAGDQPFIAPPIRPAANFVGLVDLVAAPLPLLPGGLAPPVPFLAIGTPPQLAAIVGPGPGTTVAPPGNSGPATIPTPQPRIEVEQPSAVPEPGTWATMLLGFALIGWRIRSRRQVRVMVGLQPER